MTEKKEQGRPFAIESELRDGLFHVMLQGRLDANTAPELLRRYEEAEGQADAVLIDAEHLEYVSSAGLRALLVLYKSLRNRRQFRMIHVSPEVKEIMQVTGFDQFLLSGGL